MRKVKLNGRKMDTREHAHRHLRRQLRLPEYYGANLDALWDLLSTCTEELQVTLIHYEALVCALGDYGRSIRKLFLDAEGTNRWLSFRIK